MSPLENMYRDGARERDLDNFLVEEFHASIEFRNWVLSRLEGAFRLPDSGEVKIRKSPPRASSDGRQTDVQVSWFEQSELRACIIIESKVGSDFQAGQAESYPQEVRAFREQLGAKAAASLLVAPAAKFTALAPDGAFDAELRIVQVTRATIRRLRDRSLM